MPDAEFRGAVRKGADVLGQATPAEAQAGLQETAADPAVVGQGFGQQI